MSIFQQNSIFLPTSVPFFRPIYCKFNMDWLSLCVCGTKSNLNNEKTRKDGKGKKNKNKKSKKQSKQNKSHKTSLSLVDDSFRKLQDEQVENEIIKKEWTNGKVIKCFDDCAKNQVDANNSTDLTKIDNLPNNRWSYQIDDDHDDFKEFRKEFSEKNVDEFHQQTRDFDYDDNAVLHSRCASNTVVFDEDDKQVKCISDEKEHDEEGDLNESVSRSVTSGEPEDWISEFEEKQDVLVKPSFNTKFKERTSSRINFSSEEQTKLKTRTSSKRESRNILPPIKRKSCAESRMNNEELQKNCGEMNKFGFKRSAAFCEQSNIRRKLNSCSFEVRSFEDEERNGKTRIRGDGSMIPRLTSSVQQGMNLIKSEGDKTEILQNGILLRVKTVIYKTCNKEN